MTRDLKSVLAATRQEKSGYWVAEAQYQKRARVVCRGPSLAIVTAGLVAMLQERGYQGVIYFISAEMDPEGNVVHSSPVGVGAMQPKEDFERGRDTRYWLILGLIALMGVMWFALCLKFAQFTPGGQ